MAATSSSCHALARSRCWPAGGRVSLFGQQQSYSISGSRPEGQAFLLDNGDIQNWWNHGTGSGALGSSLGVDSIGEFQTMTDTYSAQFGGNGSVMNAVSKSGTNAFHGSLYEFLRNSDLDARNFFDGATAPPFRRNQFGVTAGGPVKKDKAFFFVNYEGLRQSLGQTVRALVPDANAQKGISAVQRSPGRLTPARTVWPTSASIPPWPRPSPSTRRPVSSPPTALPMSAGRQPGRQRELSLAALRLHFLRERFDSSSAIFRTSQPTPRPSPPTTSMPTWPEIDSTHSHFVTLQERHIFGANLINIATFQFQSAQRRRNQQHPNPGAQLLAGLGLVGRRSHRQRHEPLGPQASCRIPLS